MADNSIREQIIQNIITTMEGINGIKTVVRENPATFNDLKAKPATDLPFISIVGALPSPIKYYYKGSSAGAVQSELFVTCTFFGLENNNPDEKISYWLDEIWQAVNADRKRGGLAENTEVTPAFGSGVDLPYIAFFVDIKVTYRHTLEQI